MKVVESVSTLMKSSPLYVTVTLFTPATMSAASTSIVTAPSTKGTSTNSLLFTFTVTLPVALTIAIVIVLF